MGIFTKRFDKKKTETIREYGDKLYEQKQAYKAQLIEAYKSNKLKSKRLIAEAESYIGN